MIGYAHQTPPHLYSIEKEPPPKTDAVHPMPSRRLAVAGERQTVAVETSNAWAPMKPNASMIWVRAGVLVSSSWSSGLAIIEHYSN